MKKLYVNFLRLIVTTTAVLIFIEINAYTADTSKPSDQIEYSKDLTKRIPKKVLDALAKGNTQNIIVLFNDNDIQNISYKMRREARIKSENTNILQVKFNKYSSLKRSVLDGIPPSELTVLQDYDFLPMIFAKVTSLKALSSLLTSPEVVAIYENVGHQLLTTESLPIINQPIANRAGLTGDGTTVAVLDTGADHTLADFGSCTQPGQPTGCRVIHSQDFAPNDGQLDDPNGHGTNVSSIVAHVATGTSIAVLDVFTGPTAFANDIIDAINWAIRNQQNLNIVAMNLSLGIAGSQHNQECANSWATNPFANARAAGIIPVVASGNDGFDGGINEPACAPGAIRVGAVYDADIGSFTSQSGNCTDNTTRIDQICCFSNSGNLLSILAPGCRITAGGIQMCGTSQATPHVSGTVAVLRSRDGLPQDSLDDTLRRMTSTGLIITDPRNEIRRPRLDLFAATGSLSWLIPLISNYLNYSEYIGCEGDYDSDKDIDGVDLFTQTKGGTGVSLADFAENFGRYNCPK